MTTETDQSYVARCVTCSPGRERPARDGGLTCRNCVDRITTKLDELGTNYRRLTAAPSGGMMAGRRAPGFRSTPPCDLHRLTLRDPRTFATAPGEAHSAPNFAITWARWMREIRGQAPAALPADTDVAFQHEIGYLLVSVDWATRQPWVVDFAAQLRVAHSQLCSAITGVRKPRPWGNCVKVTSGPESDPASEHYNGSQMTFCGTALYPPRGKSSVTQCSACGEPYDALSALLARAS